MFRSEIRETSKRLREWLCLRLRCEIFDRSASEIVDVATADRDRLAEEIRELRIRVGDLSDGGTL